LGLHPLRRTTPHGSARRSEEGNDMPRMDYCVILCRRPVDSYQPFPRTRRFYIGAPSAEHALRTASTRHPQYRPIGIELSDLPELEFLRSAAPPASSEWLI
jgi:hypothetical protein